MRQLLLAFLFFLHANSVHASENDTISFFENAKTPLKKRTHLLNYTVAGLYPVSMSWLYTQWYKDYPQSSFHFFNDNGEWMQMDKFGHFWDAYSIAKPLAACYRWAGYDNRKSVLYSCGIAFAYQTTIEIFDGFSSEWGFSTGDVLCNTGGVALFGIQQLVWQEQRIKLKYSFAQSRYSKYRPGELGSSLPENILKDYNGLTYWLTVNPWLFFKDRRYTPDWLCVSFGFGADGMTGGSENPTEVDGKPIPSFRRTRQYYFSLDVDLTRIKTKSKFLKGAFRIINIVKLPCPALEVLDNGTMKFHTVLFSN